MKKVKVPLFDVNVQKMFYTFATVLSTVFSFVFIFYTIPADKKCIAAVGFVIFLALVYFAIWFYANCKKKATFKIRNTRIEVVVGDIFAENGKAFTHNTQ